MKQEHHQQRFVHHKGTIKSSSGFFTTLVVPIALIFVFVVARGGAPASSELAYVEHSALGESAGSVVPASCDSNNAFAATYDCGLTGGTAGTLCTSGSHKNPDCQTLCPDGTHYYDPYYDLSATTCPPTVRLLFGDTFPFIRIASFTTDNASLPSNQNTTLRWTVNNATSCAASGPPGWRGSTIALPSGSQVVSGSKLLTVDVVRSYTLTCTDGTKSQAQTIAIEWFCSSGCL